MASAPTPLVRALRRYLRNARKDARKNWVGPPYGPPPRAGVKTLARLSGVAQPRISEVLHGKRLRFSVADAARLTVVTEIPLEILLGLDLVRVTCPACGWSVLRRRELRSGGPRRYGWRRAAGDALARHQHRCPRA